jgi:hypothetical protein
MDERYFNWLYEQVRPENKRLVPYVTVCALAHRIIFDWSVPNDDNRAADGKELRYEFEEEMGLPRPRDTEWMGLDSSIFEMLVALTRRCDLAIGIGLDGWFDIFMTNLGLEPYNDVAYHNSDREKVERILHKLNNRSYSKLGKGGLFPLRSSEYDQRKVELWYQMAAFMTENHMY